jgi:3'(2'), 5'-bisphosphate nucleotidase
MQNLSMILTHAIEAAIEASGAIMHVYSKSFEKEIKKDGSPVTEADLLSSKIISTILQKTKIPVICEELDIESYEVRKNWNQLWLVDPLDGTKEFIKKNGEFAVNIALIENSIPIFGIVCSPVDEVILIGGKDIGVHYFSFEQSNSPENWIRIEKKSLNKPIVIAASRSHGSVKDKTFFEEIQLKFGEATFIEKGSALKFIDLALGKADVYPRFAPTMEWDTASGHAIIDALGGTIIDAESNQVLKYNKQDLYNPHFIVKSEAFMTGDV